MGRALEIIGVQATAPGATQAAFSAVTGNSLTIRDSVKPIWLSAIGQSRQAAGFLRVTSPLLHDAVQGIQMHAPIGQSVTLWQGVQRLYAQDTLVVQGTGSATAGDIEQAFLIVHYEELPGVDAYLIDKRELISRGEDIYTSLNTLSTGTTGGWSGSEALSAEVDQFKANTDYALIGWVLGSTVAAGAIRYVGQDWGNLGVGGPGLITMPSAAHQTRDWFVQVSKLTGMPSIPVMNASNKSNTTVDALVDENGGDPIVSTIMVRLAPRARGKRQ